MLGSRAQGNHGQHDRGEDDRLHEVGVQGLYSIVDGFDHRPVHALTADAQGCASLLGSKGLLLPIALCSFGHRAIILLWATFSGCLASMLCSGFHSFLSPLLKVRPDLRGHHSPLRFVQVAVVVICVWLPSPASPGSPRRLHMAEARHKSRIHRKCTAGPLSARLGPLGASFGVWGESWLPPRYPRSRASGTLPVWANWPEVDIRARAQVGQVQSETSPVQGPLP